MQGWLVVGAWIFAVLFAAVVLGFAGYELTWKTRRLAAEQARLAQLLAELAAIGTRLQNAADRLGRVR
jgi:Zn-dependent protease